MTLRNIYRFDLIIKRLYIFAYNLLYIKNHKVTYAGDLDKDFKLNITYALAPKGKKIQNIIFPK